MTRPTISAPRTDKSAEIAEPFGRGDGAGYTRKDFPGFGVGLSEKGQVEFKSLTDWQTGGSQGYRLSLSLAGEANVTKPFLQNPWVHACVMARARAISSVPLRLYRKDGSMVEESPLLDLLKRPNPLLSQKKLWRTQSVYMDLFGECFWFMLKRRARKDGYSMDWIQPGEMPDEIWPVRGDVVQEVMDSYTQLPVAWRLGSGSMPQFEYPIHAVAQFAEVDPYNPLRGVGPMQAAWRTATKEFGIDRYDDALIKNGGSPGGVLSVNGVMNEASIRAMRQAWNEAHNSTENHRRTAVLPLGTKYEQMGFTPQDMEFKDLRVWNREVVLSVFGVTRPILGLTEGLNYASSREAFRVFWEVGIVPALEFFADEFNSKILGRLNSVESEYTAKFDLTDVASLKETLDSKVDRTMKLFQQCGRSFDEAAKLAGWAIDPVTDGERMFVPASMQPLPEEVAALARTMPATPKPTAGRSQPAAKEVQPEPVHEVQKAPLAASRQDIRNRVLAEKDAILAGREVRIAKRVTVAFRDYLLAVRMRLKAIAGTENKETRPQFAKIIITEQEVEHLLQVNALAFAAELQAAIRNPYADVFDAAAKHAAGQVGASLAFMTHADPQALEFLRSKEVLLAEGPMSTLAVQVQRAIIKTLATAPENITSVAEAIRAQLNDLVDEVEAMIDALPERAMLIARTETNSIFNAATQMNFAQGGIGWNEWATAGDERVRQPPQSKGNHVELNGMVVRVGHIFKHNLRYPGDPQASVEQVARCRCAILAVVEPVQ